MAPNELRAMTDADLAREVAKATERRRRAWARYANNPSRRNAWNNGRVLRETDAVMLEDRYRRLGY
jgi:hypothetical protein